ncbi:uncharacterized protein LOC101738118 [Bombyx mori]|uniref:CHK kinase-like domain-containing protein n=1 Tax=Bombyx mori TaxID=7091 RepID=A0A8R2G8T8_BOMMO|nr:uncharacterized protein LOC101738118 [Bombyx mori]
MRVEEKSFVRENFQANITNCNEFPPSLERHIRNIIIKEGYTKYSVDKREICTNGGNYLASLYEIDIKGTTQKGKKETNIFIKKMKPGENSMKIISIPEAYKFETFAYEELLKVYTELQNEAKVPADERFKAVKDFGEFDAQAIILENLAKKGYKTAHRMDVVSLEYAEMAIKQLAKFHALSFALRERKPEYYESKIKTIPSRLNLGNEWNGFVKSMQALTLNFLNDNLRKKVENILPRLFDNITDYFEGNDSAVCCLCHGDFRPNNIMMKEIDGEISETIPIDYQLIYYGCPIIDFLYFVFTATDKEFRRAHLTHLKTLYYDTMQNFLEYFDISIESVYSKTDFDNDYKKKLDYGLIVTILYCPFMFVDENDVPDITEADLGNISFTLHDKYKDKIQGTVEDFIEWGLI